MRALDISSKCMHNFTEHSGISGRKKAWEVDGNIDCMGSFLLLQNLLSIIISENLQQNQTKVNPQTNRKSTNNKINLLFDLNVKELHAKEDKTPLLSYWARFPLISDRIVSFSFLFHILIPGKNWQYFFYILYCMQWRNSFSYRSAWLVFSPIVLHLDAVLLVISFLEEDLFFSFSSFQNF